MTTSPDMHHPPDVASPHDREATRTSLVAQYPVMELLEVVGLLERSSQIFSRHDHDEALLGDLHNEIDQAHRKIANTTALDVVAHCLSRQVPTTVLVAYCHQADPDSSLSHVALTAVGAGLIPDDGLVDHHSVNDRAMDALASGCFERLMRQESPLSTPPMTAALMTSWVNRPHAARTQYLYSKKAMSTNLLRDPYMVGAMFLSRNIEDGVMCGESLVKRKLVPAATIVDWASTAILHGRIGDDGACPPSSLILGIERMMTHVPVHERAARIPLLTVCAAMMAHRDTMPPARAACERMIGMCCETSTATPAIAP
jgi:hypothetical protein